MQKSRISVKTNSWSSRDDLCGPRIMARRCFSVVHGGVDVRTLAPRNLRWFSKRAALWEAFAHLMGTNSTFLWPVQRVWSNRIHERTMRHDMLTYRAFPLSSTGPSPSVWILSCGQCRALHHPIQASRAVQCEARTTPPRSHPGVPVKPMHGGRTTPRCALGNR